MKEQKTKNNIFPANLARFLSLAGLASRRKSSEIVKDGNVEVNGKTVCEPGFKVNQDDCVHCYGKLVELGVRYYVMLNKPSGYICTAEDPNAPQKAIDLIDIPNVRLFSIGRLDKDSEGMLLFTNDGDYTDRLTHPRYEITKTYRITTDWPLPKDAIKQFKEGIEDEGELLRASEVVKAESDCVYIFKLKEGKKREIRRMIRYAQRKTTRLQRIAVGELSLGNLPLGKWRFLNENEVKLSLK